jgi:hypothetical protein
MSDIPEVKTAKREPFDLGEFDAEFAGQTVSLLRNPTRGFRVSYVKAAWNASLGLEGARFREHLAVIMGAEDGDAVQTVVEDMPDDVFHWLFLYTVGDYDSELKAFKTHIEPRIMTLWDEYITERVKARAAQGSG